jgi:hypothetical protein
VLNYRDGPLLSSRKDFREFHLEKALESGPVDHVLQLVAANAIGKLGARNRLDAIRIAGDAGWL